MKIEHQLTLYRMWLLHRFIKKTQKTPQSDIDLARKRKKGEEMSKSRKTKKNPHMGGTFDDFLREEGIYEAVQTTAMKRILAMQLAEAMKERNLTKIEMARRMRTSRVQLDRLLVNIFR